MASFTSNASKHQAELTVNRMFADILHTQPLRSAKSTTSNKSKSASKFGNDRKALSMPTPLSSTQILSQQLQPQLQQTRLSLKTGKSSQNNNKVKKLLKKKHEQDKKFQKFIKYSMIKNKMSTDPESLTLEEHKYLKKLAKRNINALQKYSKIDDFEIEQEMSSVKNELLKDLAPKKQTRLRKKLAIPAKKGSARSNANNQINDFDYERKLQKGLISAPGLTPGLAPVDYDDDEEEEEEED
ncbi:hypothetical protein LELG_02187 [Lodderomyces elongisporus NRRL YB-4239]|uniref:Regulator of rDNA transcription 14 n=1 Tax=Lodderomyces elongisporus (strain ATCC 11503 / CBS 2605 / JCM 1781 / NBRC 1676 / NRRL YB-4239) TaxID=379508 RepID=RRT14_LODEL|nr:RecName: Full=Regulator of rDNA transcription 14 [Lodderomyces elongisporus NRRL YB-4239]EDK44008.1 hypothetical protein LELG_02187 [Lodderomyces elongisporus NRRL YB-4239]